MMAARRSPWAWACAGLLLGALAGGLVYAPARWLAGALVWADAPLQLHNPSGTVWQGDAQLVLRSQAQEQTALPGRVRWNIRPAWQDRSPGLRMAWQADCCLDAPWVWHATGGLQSVELRLSDLPAGRGLRLPAALLVGLGTPWNTLQLDGQLVLETRNLQLLASAGSARLEGEVVLDALRLSTSLSTLKPLGSYRVALRGGTSTRLTLTTLEGALQLSGTGELSPGRLVFDGEARAAEDREEALSNLLNIIGQRQGARSLIHLG
jgi:general secretion pathway protein N